MKRCIILILSLTYLYSCHVEEPVTPPKASLKDTIARTWTIKDAKENGTTTADFNGNTITFSKDGSYKAVSPLDTVSGAWAFNTNETHVIFDGNAKPDELISDWEILELSSRRFRWRWTHDQENIEGLMEP